MVRKEIEDKYKNLGLDTEYGFDEPNKIYEPHRHEKTYLFTLSGNLLLRLDESDWQDLKQGSEAVIGDNQLHEAKVCSEGWEYVAGWHHEVES